MGGTTASRCAAKPINRGALRPAIRLRQYERLVVQPELRWSRQGTGRPEAVPAAVVMVADGPAVNARWDRGLSARPRLRTVILRMGTACVLRGEI